MVDNKDANTKVQFQKREAKVARCELWAKYCFPHDSWWSPEFQNKLHSKHLMLCTKHFKKSSFIDNFGKRLVKSAVPDEECDKVS
ncbi:unnamed protein product [Parnassius apollo]|uniref:(apollo) hypothetical protein n=1 Tax=Parnassius apollo TaxID=110799 RepID=A0A8S3XF21_PARAO|nr:unnamed protein product [Parnassius apollo]